MSECLGEHKFALLSKAHIHSGHYFQNPHIQILMYDFVLLLPLLRMQYLAGGQAE